MTDLLALAAAIHSSDLVAVQQCVQHGADPNGKDEWDRPMLYLALGPEVDLSILQFLLSNGAAVTLADWSGTPLLHTAATSSTLPVLDALLDAGADLHTGCLTCTVMNDRVDLATRLIERGAPVDFADESGRTALLHAFELGSPPIAHLLIEHGADPKRVTRDGASVLHLMAGCFVKEVHVPLIELAKGLGVDPQRRDNESKVAAERTNEPADGDLFR